MPIGSVGRFGRPECDWIDTPRGLPVQAAPGLRKSASTTAAKVHSRIAAFIDEPTRATLARRERLPCRTV